MELLILICIGLLIALAACLFTILNPNVELSCMIGKHKYFYAGKKSGMVMNRKSKQVIGTMREVYTCKCGKEKPATNEDYL
tara:strand:+ start:339 stop:581 length:243 start_codon:yes stop_codon:yes gene_type:complete